MHNNSAARFLFHPVCSKALPIAWISVAARRLRKLAPRVPIKFGSLIFSTCYDVVLRTAISPSTNYLEVKPVRNFTDYRSFAL